MHVRYPGLMALGALVLCPVAGHAALTDPTQLSVEELMQVSVYSASKFDQKAADAPASVTVITADEIRAYGYRTLADVLRSVRGFFVTYDRNYNYLGVRGFERPGDYDSRVLLMVDGMRLNDTIYDTAGIGTEFPISVDMIERLEIVRGPGSAIYGSNAFFAVINVITRRGRDVGPLEGSVESASWRTDKERVATGGRSGDDVEWLFSGSRYRSEGQNLDFPMGHAQGLDGDEYEKALGKLSLGELGLMGAYSTRDKHIPTATYGSAFGDPRERTVDQWQFLSADYRHVLSGAWEIEPRATYGRYRYTGDYPYASGPSDVNRDASAAQWWTTEVKLTGRLGPHRVVSGFEYQDNFQQDQVNYDGNPYVLYTDERRSSARGGVYVEDDVALLDRVRANAGVRFDHYSTAGDAFSPRLALVWTPQDATTLKFLAGSAFRAPNDYELYYGDNVTIMPNPNLAAEKVATFEAIAEHYVDPNFRVLADLYYSRIHGLIEQVSTPTFDQFQNLGRVRGEGAEFEVERIWTGDARLRASYAWQQTRDLIMDTGLTDSPRHLVKLNLALPVLGRALGTGTEVQYISRRRTLAGNTTGGAVIANFTLLSHPFANRFEASATLYNVFDHAHADPGRPEHEPNLDVIEQDGRSFRLKLTYGF